MEKKIEQKFYEWLNSSALSNEEKAAMGKAGRKKVVKEFDRSIIVKAYLNEIEKITEKESVSV